MVLKSFDCTLTNQCINAIIRLFNYYSYHLELKPYALCQMCDLSAANSVRQSAINSELIVRAIVRAKVRSIVKVIVIKILQPLRNNVVRIEARKSSAVTVYRQSQHSPGKIQTTHTIMLASRYRR